MCVYYIIDSTSVHLIRNDTGNLSSHHKSSTEARLYATCIIMRELTRRCSARNRERVDPMIIVEQRYFVGHKCWLTVKSALRLFSRPRSRIETVSSLSVLSVQPSLRTENRQSNQIYREDKNSNFVDRSWKCDDTHNRNIHRYVNGYFTNS